MQRYASQVRNIYAARCLPDIVGIIRMRNTSTDASIVSITTILYYNTTDVPVVFSTIYSDRQ